MQEKLRHDSVISTNIWLSAIHLNDSKLSVRKAGTCYLNRCPERVNGISKHPAFVTTHPFAHQVFYYFPYAFDTVTQQLKPPIITELISLWTISGVCSPLHQVPILFLTTRKLSTQNNCLHPYPIYRGWRVQQQDTLKMLKKSSPT